jgi:hypothetical protein
MSQNPYGSGGRHTARNPSERGMNPPPVPASHASTVSPGPTSIAKSDPQANADRVRGNRRDPANGDASGANRRAR